MKDRTSQPAEPGTATPRRPIVEVWTIAWPTVLTMTSYTVMQFVDRLMVAQVGPLELAAQGNGGIWAFTPIAFAMGVLTVVNTYVAQNLGAGRPEDGPKYAWAAAWLSAAIWLAVLLPLAAALPWIFRLLLDPASIDQYDRLIALQSGYGRILLVGGVVLLVGRGMHHYFFGLHRPKVITVAAVIGNGVNVFANWVLIFGHFGLPALGLYGAAYGTLIGTAVELLIPAAIFLGPKMHAELNTRAAWRPRWRPMRDLLRIGWPASVQFGNEIICWAVFMTALVGKFGENHMTAGWAALGYMHLSFMPAVGFSVATSSLVGRYIGAGQPDVAAARARLGLTLAMAYMTVCAVLFYVLRYPLIDFFIAGRDTTPEQARAILEIGAKLMICAAVFQTADAFGIVYSGALRGAGDTVWPGAVTMAYSWVFIVGGGWSMTVLWPELESVGPWIGAAAYIIILGVTMAWRFESGAWRRIDLLGDGRRDAAHVAPVTPGPPAADPDAEVRDFAESESEGESGSIA